MSYEESNAQYTRVKDTLLDAGVLQGLVSAGVIPQSFRVLVGSVSVAGTDDPESFAVVDDSGAQLVLPEGSHIAYVAAGVTTTLAGGTSVQLGLALDALDGAAPDLATAVSGVGAMADVNTFGLGLKFAATPAASGAGGVVVGDNQWLVVNAIGAFTAGALQVVLVVV
jgi:hypothetical protein